MSNALFVKTKSLFFRKSHIFVTGLPKLLGVVAACFLLLVPVVAEAQAVTLNARGGDTIFIWKNKAAPDEAFRLIQAEVYKTHKELIDALLSCVVPSGTEATITSRGFITEDIMIISGEFAGCRGNVAAKYIR